MNKRDYLLTRINVQKMQLESMPAFMTFEREMIKLDIQELEEKLQKLGSDLEDEPFKASLTFSGSKVFDRLGIQSTFGLGAVEKFTEAVKEVGKSQLNIQRDRSHQLDVMITGTVKGSFGFILEPPPRSEPLLFDNSLLHDAFIQTCDLLEAAAQEDENALEHAAELSKAAVDAVCKFANYLQENQCTCKIGNYRKSYSITALDTITQRLSHLEISEEELVWDGTLTGVFTEKPRFEFVGPENKRISGKISNTDPVLIKNLPKVLGKKVRITVHCRHVRSGQKYYTLLKFDDLETLPNDTINENEK